MHQIFENQHQSLTSKHIPQSYENFVALLAIVQLMHTATLKHTWFDAHGPHTVIWNWHMKLKPMSNIMAKQAELI